MPFLFWVIVSIGSRRYTEQSTLTPFLAQPVTQLALQSITTRNNPIERIKGLLLLLNWPFPSSAFYRDPSFLLAGTLLHMAMQCGLNAPTFSEDFTKSYTKTTEQEHLRRAELWAHVVITYQMYGTLGLFAGSEMLTAATGHVPVLGSQIWSHSNFVASSPN